MLGGRPLLEALIFCRAYCRKKIDFSGIILQILFYEGKNKDASRIIWTEVFK